MSQKDIMKQNLQNEIDDYALHLLYIKDVCATYDHIGVLKADKLIDSPNFTLVAESALYDSLVMALARLYDKSKQAKSIPQLIEKCMSNKNLFENDVASDLNSFQAKLSEDEYISAAIEVLQHRRDNFYAHNDKQFFGSKGNNDTTYLPMYKIWALIEFTDNALSCLLKQLCDKTLPDCKYNKDLEKSLKS